MNVRAAVVANTSLWIPLIREPQVVHWILRLALAAEFVGHGAFGILTKAAWVPYFGVVGIPESMAWRLMPVVGIVDIALGILALVRPIPAVLFYMAFWGFWTALLRPLTGEGWWELLERAGNFGVPLAFLVWSRPGSHVRDWLSVSEPWPVTQAQVVRLAWILRITTAALLIGHGGIGAFMQKPDWIGYFGAAGITPEMAEAASYVARLGWFEIALGLLVLFWSVPGVLIFAFTWKVGVELLRPLAGEPFWEFIERGGSYAAPLALLYVQRWTAVPPWTIVSMLGSHPINGLMQHWRPNASPCHPRRSPRTSNISRRGFISGAAPRS
jgi:hypothetical protein